MWRQVGVTGGKFYGVLGSRGVVVNVFTTQRSDTVLNPDLDKIGYKGDREHIRYWFISFVSEY